MTSFIEDVGKDAAYSVFGKLKEWYSYIESYSDNIQALEGKHRELTNLKETIESQVERESDNLRKATKKTEGWLEDVDKLITKEDLKELLDEEIRKGKDKCCFGRMQCNLKHRYQMSKSAEDLAKKIKDVMDAQPEPSRVTEPIRISDLKSAPGEFLGDLQSRVDLVDKIIKKLEDDDVDVVGIFGMGAIGKTTLVKEISNKAKNKFDKTVMVEISEAPNMERIQYQIADQLGIKDLSDAHTVELRATKLHTGLTKEGRRTLVILDNIWEKLDLAKVGIPQQSEKSSEFCCKLMVTSRNKDVCKVMGVQDTNIFEVHPLNQKEAKLLFRARVGKTDDEMNEHDKEAENRILKKCGGLPLSIVAIADVLKDQDLSTWEHFARELEKPSSMHGSIKDANRLTNTILGTSYRLIESEEKKKFFLLACLFPFGSFIRVEHMMRYGMGLGLFQDVNNLTEATDQASTWADELKSSSLLLPDYYIHGVEHVKIQDVVRASTIEFAKQDGEVYMVEAFPRWRELETCQKYKAISLMSGTDHSRLCGLESDNLEILMLDSTTPPEFDDTFFEHMNNLKVLVLSNGSSWNKIKCDEFLCTLTTNPIQAGWKRSLRTLHLEGCVLGDIGGIGELVNLVVLSLRGSRVKELPGEAIMGNLVKLRLLDLRRCIISTGGIPTNVLGRLSQLEGLYLTVSNITKWGHNSSLQESGGTEGASTSSSTQHADDDDEEETSIDNNDKYASIDELNRLSYLNVLEMHVRLEDLPIEGDEFVNNLERFWVQISKSIKSSYFPRWSRGMFLTELDLREKRIIKCVKALLLKTEYLFLDSVVGFVEQYLHQEKEEFIRWGNIKELTIFECNKEVVESIKWSAFPNLEGLELLGLDNSSIIRHSLLAGDEAQVGGRPATLLLATPNNNNTRIFSNLRILSLHTMDSLEPYALPIHVLPLNHLTQLIVVNCKKLKYIFGEAQEETDKKNKDLPYSHLKLPLLKQLHLKDLPELGSMVEVPNLCAPPTLFTRKVIFGALEVVTLELLLKIERVWDVGYWKDNADYRSAFLHLKRLEIHECGKLKTLCPVSIAAALVHLRELKIWNCEEMTEAVVKDDDDEESDGHGDVVLFPSLEELDLYNCPKMGQFISANQSYEFPSLHSLGIKYCHEMQSLSGGPSFRAPNLTFFSYDYVKQSIPEGGSDINQFLKDLYQQRITHPAIPSLSSERVSEGDIGQQS